MDFNQITILISECKMKYCKDCPNKRLGIRNVSTYVFSTVSMKNLFFRVQEMLPLFIILTLLESVNLVPPFGLLSIYLIACTLCINKQHMLRKSVKGSGRSGGVRMGQKIKMLRTKCIVF